MKLWRVAAWLNVAIFLDLFALQVGLTIRVSTTIAEFEARTGGTADNDWGQRGLAMGFVVLLVAGALAAESIWRLYRARPSGFVLHSMLWLLLAFVVILTPLPEALKMFRLSMHLLCLTGFVWGIRLSLIATSRVRRIE